MDAALSSESPGVASARRRIRRHHGGCERERRRRGSRPESQPVVPGGLSFGRLRHCFRHEHGLLARAQDLVGRCGAAGRQCRIRAGNGRGGFAHFLYPSHRQRFCADGSVDRASPGASSGKLPPAGIAGFRPDDHRRNAGGERSRAEVRQRTADRSVHGAVHGIPSVWDGGPACLAQHGAGVPVCEFASF